jgi:hypothetical protein
LALHRSSIFRNEAAWVFGTPFDAYFGLVPADIASSAFAAARCKEQRQARVRDEFRGAVVEAQANEGGQVADQRADEQDNYGRQCIYMAYVAGAHWTMVQYRRAG